MAPAVRACWMTEANSRQPRYVMHNHRLSGSRYPSQHGSLCRHKEPSSAIVDLRLTVPSSSACAGVACLFWQFIRIGINLLQEPIKAEQRTPNSGRSALQSAGVGHRRLEAPVTEGLMNWGNLRPRLRPTLCAVVSDSAVRRPPTQPSPSRSRFHRRCWSC